MSGRMKKQAQDKWQNLLSDVFEKLSRNTVGDLKIPKEMVATLLSNVDHLRTSLQHTYATEVARVLSKVDFHKIANDVASNYTIKVNAEIHLEPKKKKKGSRR